MEGFGFGYEYDVDETLAGEWAENDFDMDQYPQQAQQTIGPDLLEGHDGPFDEFPPFDPDEIQADLQDLFPEQFNMIDGGAQQGEQESFELGPEFNFFEDDDIANTSLDDGMSGTAPEFGDQGSALPRQPNSTPEGCTHPATMHRPAATSPAQAMPLHAPAHVPQHTVSGPPLPTYTSRVLNFSEATTIISRKQNEGPPIPLQIDNDDWQIIEINLQNHAAHLFQALFHPPQTPPSKFENQTAVRYYWEHENATLSSVIALAKSDPEEAEARVLLVLQEVINTHKYGIPASAYKRNEKKFGYKVELEMSCSERLSKIVDAATRDKYVAHDILTGTNSKDLVRSPEAYLLKKVYNVHLNAKKVQDKLAAGHVPRKRNLDRKPRGTGTGKGRVNGERGLGRKNTKGHAPRSRIQGGEEAGQQPPGMEYSPASQSGEQIPYQTSKRRFEDFQWGYEGELRDTSARSAKMRRMG